MPSITVTELFKAAGLQPHGPVRWGEIVREQKPGVYVVAVVGGSENDCGLIGAPYLNGPAAKRWIASQPVIYIGRTRRALTRRIGEFYRHVYGKKSPHRGGQDVKLLKCSRWIYWSPTAHPAIAEHKMIERFRSEVGRFPFANRVRSARARN